MDLRKLRYLVAVIDAGGFRRAAERLNIAQPALTRQIRALEIELGVRLLDRSRAGITATKHGVQFAVEAREILSRIDLLQDRFRAQVGGPKIVRLGLPSAVAELVLPDLVHKMRETDPQVHIICTEDATDLVENVEAGALDLAVASFAERWQPLRCRSKHMFEEQDYLVCQAPRCPCAPIDLEALLARPLILTPLPNQRRQFLHDLGEMRGMRLNVVAEAGAVATQMNLVIAGHGSAVLPFSVAHQMIRKDIIAMTPIRGLKSTRRMLFSDRSDNPGAVNIVAEVLEALLHETIFRQARRFPAGADGRPAACS